MPTYLYCLLPAASEPPPTDLAGIAGEHVRRLVIGDVAAWVGTIDESAVARSVETARLHDAVVRAALRTGVTPLPARGGQRFDDDARCMAELSGRATAISAALARIAGCVEMSVHVTAPEREAPAAGGAASPGAATESAGAETGRGRRYLEALRARGEVEHKVQAGLASARALLEDALGDLVHAEAGGAAESPGRLTLCHLVRRPDVARYRAIVKRTMPGHALGIRVTGPYAPYSFSEIR